MEIIDWRINYECNNQCDYCFGNKEIHHSPCIDRLVLNRLGESSISKVTITGGEPLIAPKRLVYIVDTLSKCGKGIYLSTNGHRFSEVYEEINNKITMLGLPLDGYSRETNIVNGRNIESFNQVKRIIESTNNQYKIKIGTVVTSKNNRYDWLFNIAKLLDNSNVAVWRIYEIVPENRGSMNRALLLNHEEVDELNRIVDKLKSMNHNYKIELVTRKSRSNNYLIIQPDGSVMVPIDKKDIVEETVVGNLEKDTVEEVMRKWKELSTSMEIEYYKTRCLDFM